MKRRAVQLAKGHSVPLNRLVGVRRFGGSALRIPRPTNEPNHVNQEASRALLKKTIQQFKSTPAEIPAIINGKEIRTGITAEIRSPHDHKQVLGVYHKVTEKEAKQAIDSALEAHRQWSSLPVEQRLSVFLKMGALVSTKYRPLLNAATVLGQGKNFFQAEIDSACELIDFLNFNAFFAQEIYEDQPNSETLDPHGRGSLRSWNRVEYRALEGFVYAITPFNFTAIAANLTTAPAMMGNTVVWKPSDSAILSGYWLQKLYKEAGLPDGIINFVPGDPQLVTKAALEHPQFAGLHFTGSTDVFRGLWQKIGNNVERYVHFPRLVGETGGKNFVFAHSSANIDGLVTALTRGAFEYSGQKCSAASRAYIPASIWNQVKTKLLDQISRMKVGNPEELSTMIGPVIHKAAFDRIKEFIQRAKEQKDVYTLIAGGQCDDSVGYFVHPTVFQTTNPHAELMQKEIFGPVLTVFVYPDEQLMDTLKICEKSHYGLTGAVWASDRYAINSLLQQLPFGCGNLYINDKPTGAVVGQQPFGGGRASGTNDKAGSKLNLLRWVNVRSVKENFYPDVEVTYPYMHAQ
jgi:1-pyrroline-5-carboxylate dehydrogenase